MIEVDVGDFCVCMPAMRSLLGRLLPLMFGSTKGNSSIGYISSQKKVRIPDSAPNTSSIQLVEIDYMVIGRATTVLDSVSFYSRSQPTE